MKTGIYWQDPKYALRPGRGYIRDPSLVLDLPLYKLDGDSFMSKDAYGHLCSVTGALWTPQGRRFDGVDDYLDLGTPEALNITGKELTLEAWVYVESWAGCDSYATIVENYETATGGFLIQKQAANSRFYAGIYADGWRAANPTGDLAEHTWFHLMAIYNGATLKFYVDTEEVASVASTADIGSSSRNVCVGGKNAANSFHGKIGEVRVYIRGLTGIESRRNRLATKRRYQ